MSLHFFRRTNVADSSVLPGVRWQIVWKTLRRLLLWRLFLFFQTQRQEEDHIHVYRYVDWVRHYNDWECAQRSIDRVCSCVVLAGSGQCIVDKARRNWCPFCRLQKCLRVNMNVTGKCSLWKQYYAVFNFHNDDLLLTDNY